MTAFKINLDSPKADVNTSRSGHFGELALSPKDNQTGATSSAASELSNSRKSSDALFWSVIIAIALLAAFIGWYSFLRSPVQDWTYLSDNNGVEYSYRIESKDKAKIKMLMSYEDSLKTNFGMKLVGMTDANTIYDHSEAEVRFSDDFKQFVIGGIENIDREGKVINGLQTNRGWQPITEKHDGLPIGKLASVMKPE